MDTATGKKTTTNATAALATPPAIMETVHQVWDTQTGGRVEVGPDPEVKGQLQLRSLDPDGKLVSSISCSPEVAKLLNMAVVRAVEDMTIEA